MYVIINLGDKMTVAIDKYTKDVVKPNNKYIYLFDNETLEELLQLNLHCIYYKNCNYADINLTDYNIDCIKKAKVTDEDFDVLPKKIDYKFAIIVPNYNNDHGNYNGKTFFQNCIESVLNQTYKNFEIVFIDDVSTDKSVGIAKGLLKPPHKVIELKQKRLNGGARNEAYLHLSDNVDYIFCVDSDDWLLNGNVLEMINNKLQTKPDVLFCGLSQYKNNVLKTCFIPQYKDKYEAIRGWSGVGKVIKKSLATRQECLYNEGTLKEDKNQHCKICFYMNNFALLKEPIYVWNQMNSKSVTTIREKVIWGTSTIRHYADTIQFALSIKGQDPKIDRFMEERIRMTKQEVDQNGDRQW